jgi:hypothetical protein
MRNVDSRMHSLRFDCCVFLFYSFSAVSCSIFACIIAPSDIVQSLDAFATQSAIRRHRRPFTPRHRCWMNAERVDIEF